MSGRSPLAAEPAVTAVLEAIRRAIVAVTGSSLVGLYLLGSLTTGDFDATVSDLDVLAVLADAPRQRLAARLRRMHARASREHPAWGDRPDLGQDAGELGGERVPVPRGRRRRVAG
jgi:hypothetical protein